MDSFFLWAFRVGQATRSHREEYNRHTLEGNLQNAVPATCGTATGRTALNRGSFQPLTNALVMEGVSAGQQHLIAAIQDVQTNHTRRVLITRTWR
jgi:hypothetical protein